MVRRGAALGRRLLTAAATSPGSLKDAVTACRAPSTRRFLSSSGGNGATAPGAKGGIGATTSPGSLKDAITACRAPSTRRFLSSSGGNGATAPGAKGGIGAMPPGTSGGIGATPPGANGGRGATPPGANGGIGATHPGADGATPPGIYVWDGAIPPAATSDTRAVLARLLLLPTEKITMGDVTQGWVSTAALRKSLYIAVSALVGSLVGGGTLLYNSLAKRNSKQLIEGLDKMEKVATEKREYSEKNEKLRRDEWENRIHIILMELATKLFKLEEKELKHRKTLTDAEQLLKNFGFTEDPEVYYGIGRKLREVQLQMDFLREELSKSPEDSPVAAELSDMFASIESQVNALKKKIIEAGMATEADFEKGLSSKKDIKK